LGILFAVSSPAQIRFERTYGVFWDDYGLSVQQTSNGGYVITGQTRISGSVPRDVYVIKTDSLGDTLWTRTYGGSLLDVGHSIKETSDGGYIIAGWTESFGAGSYDVYLIKTDSLGNTLWTRTYGGTADDEGESVQQTSDGGYIIAGWTRSFGAGSADVYLIKTDPLGDTLWTKTYGGTSYEYGSSVQQISNGNYVIAGYTGSFGAGNADVYFIKTDSLGDTLWTKTFGENNSDEGYSVQQTSDGGYIITGNTSSFGVAGDIYLVKTNPLGDTLWTRYYGGTSTDRGRSVHQTSDGGFIIAGETQSFGVGSWDVYLIRTETLGDSLWTRTYGGFSGDRGYSVQQTSDGGYIIAGITNSFGVGNADVYLIKTDGNGQVGMEEDESRRITPNTKFVLYQNQPNPFHHSTVIGYSIPVHGSVTLKVYDITGSLVETLVNKLQNPGVYQVQWEGKNQSSGIYFYRFQAGDVTKTRQMILLH
jgi:hypothetical protein